MTEHEYSIQSWDDEKKTVRYMEWSALRKAAQEYYKLVGHPDPEGLRPYLLETYGLDADIALGQVMTGGYHIVDEQKFTIFLLKFM